MNGRQMLDHVIQARMEWESRTEVLLVAVDFQKAYDSVSFSFLETTLTHIGLGMFLYYYR